MDAAQYLAGGAPTMKFANLGDTIKGKVLHTEVNQQTDINKKPKFWDDEGTRPMMQVVATLQTEERDPQVEGDDGCRRVFIKGDMERAVREVIAAAGWRGKPLEGATLGIRYVANGTPPRQGLNAPKLFKAFFEPPVGGSDPFEDDEFGEGREGAASGPSDTPPDRPAVLAEGDSGDWSEEPF